MKTRQRGKLFFILTRGVVGIGFSLAAFSFLGNLVSHPELTWKQLRAGGVIMALFCSVLGYGWGHFLWKNNEERYLGDRMGNARLTETSPKKR